MSSSAALAQQRPEKPRVLIVDDDRLGTEIRAELIRFSGFNAEVAFSGFEALAKAESQNFDIFVIDYDMPGMNGLELTIELRRRGYNSPIAMLSGRLEPPVEAGVELLSCYISKGEGPNVLIESLNSFSNSFFLTRSILRHSDPLTPHPRLVRSGQPGLEFKQFAYKNGGQEPG